MAGLFHHNHDDDDDNWLMQLFLNRCVVVHPGHQCGEIELIDKPFYSQNDGITGYACPIRSQGMSFIEEVHIYIIQVSPHDDGKLNGFVYPLHHLDRFTPFLITISEGEKQQSFFKGIGKRFLIKYEGMRYHIENNGDLITKLYATKDGITSIIEIEDIDLFTDLLADVKSHANKFLKKLKQETG